MELIDLTSNISQTKLQEINNYLKEGKLIIFPTETVYGLGAIATDDKAVKKIYIAKGRKSDNPLIVHLSSVSEIEKYAHIENEIERKLINTFMPGPFTIILKKKDNIPSAVSGGLDTVGIRVPSNKIAHSILSHNNLPIAAPSANISGRPSGTNIEDIYNEFKDKVSCIINGGNSQIGLESTVVRVVDNIPIILRPGYITKEDILNTIGSVKVDDNIFKKDVDTPLSPGMKYKHYAPNSPSTLIYIKDKEAKINYFKENTTENTIIIGSKDLRNIPCKKYLHYGNTRKEISHNIFTLLRKADTFSPDKILIEGVSQDGLGLAIMNRLIRACSHKYIRINEKEILVTDENGKITRRNYEEGINKKLDNENKEEIINAFAHELTNNKENIQSFTEEIKTARKIIMIVLALLAGTLATLNINGVILNPISTVIALLAIPPVTTIFTSINKKYIENMESALECLDNLKQEITKEQTITKSKIGIIKL